MSGPGRGGRLFAPEWKDLWLVAAVLTLTLASIFLPIVQQTPLRLVVGLVFVLFVPGYTVIAALFPRHSGISNRANSAPDWLERILLSFGVSIAIAPLVGLGLNYTPWGVQPTAIVVSLAGLTLIVGGVAVIRRKLLPVEERFYLDRTPVHRVYTALQPSTRFDSVLNVLLVISILVAVSSVAYAFTVPTGDERFTEFYLLSENETGELVPDNYPTNFTEGEARPLVVGISNHEYRTVNYTVVVELQRVNTTGEEIRIVQEQRLDSFSVELEPNETWQSQRAIRPPMTGDNLRLQFLLYRGSVPNSPSAETAYRYVHLWISVRSA